MKLFFLLLIFPFALNLKAQDISILLKEADNLDRQIKEPEALEKYKQVLGIAPNNMKSLVRAAELNISIGGRQTDKNIRRLYYESALAFAKRSFDQDHNNADANYAMGMVSGKMTDVETENKKIVAFVKDAKIYSDRAVAINPNHARATYSIGKWHSEMVNLSGIKKAAVKLFYGGLPNGDLDSAIAYFERCRLLDPYFAVNYLDLAKAYRDNHRPTQAIEVLNKLLKLPLRTGDDAAIKAEGAKMLDAIQ